MAMFKNLQTMISSLQAEFAASLNQLKTDCETQINALRESINNQQLQQSSQQFEDVVQEVYERQKRGKNLIIYGVPEQEEGVQRMESDCEVVSNVLKAVRPDFIVPQDLKVYRLGQHTREAAHSRPIKITLADESEVVKFIRNNRIQKNNANFNNISLAPDRTIRQREHYKQLKRELDNRTNNGEANLRIRYINGTPKIVHLN